jgi:hypothetical protein
MVVKLAVSVRVFYRRRREIYEDAATTSFQVRVCGRSDKTRSEHETSEPRQVRWRPSRTGHARYENTPRPTFLSPVAATPEDLRAAAADLIKRAEELEKE